jgi:hypothetical protein
MIVSCGAARGDPVVEHADQRRVLRVWLTGVEQPYLNVAVAL